MKYFNELTLIENKNKFYFYLSYSLKSSINEANKPNKKIKQ
jgi:hypothetical protein